MPPLSAYKSTGLQPTRRIKRISYKTTKQWSQYGHAIKERLQIKASFKPTVNATRGMPKLAALEHVNTVMQTFRTHVKPPYLRAVSRIDGMQDTIIAHCEGSHFDLLFYKEKEEDKENTPQFAIPQPKYMLRPMRLCKANSFVSGGLIVKFRVARSTQGANTFTETEYDFVVDMSPRRGEGKVHAIKSACEEAIYRLDALHIMNTVNDIFEYEDRGYLPVVTFGARMYHSSPVDKKLGDIQSTVTMPAFEIPHPCKRITLDDVMNISGYKDNDYPYYCCPASLVELYEEKAIKGYTPTITKIRIRN